jgi:hypothetical protein
MGGEKRRERARERETDPKKKGKKSLFFSLTFCCSTTNAATSALGPSAASFMSVCRVTLESSCATK